MTIETSQHGAVLLVTINRAEAMNCLDQDTNERLSLVWKAFEADPSLLVAVLTGAGNRAFSAGADLRTFIPAFRERVLEGDESAVWNFGGGLARGMNISKPIIAAINGHALAGGLEMALACDIRLCSPNATFSLAEAKWALVPGAGGTQRLPRAIPMTHAMEMLMTGDPINAELAERIGLVSRVVPQEELLPEALRVAQRIAENGPLAVGAIKRLVQMAVTDPLNGMEAEHEALLQVMKSEDASEGPRAFQEKRQPRYSGK